MTVIAWVIFIPLQILFIPLAIIGAVLVGYKQLIVSKRLSVSQTAIEIINNRWIMHIFDLRQDKATDQLIHNLPNTSQSIAPKGSVIVAYIYSLSFVKGEYVRGMKAMLPILDMTDEGLGFGLDYTGDYQQALRTFIESENMAIGDTYFMGHKTEKGSYMAVAEIIL